MIRLALILALILAATAQAQQKPQALPPLAQDIAAALQAVGRINKAGYNSKASCSGTLIRPDVVLTAGHCARGTVRPGSTHVFVAGWNRGEYAAARRIARQITHPAYFIGGRHDPRFDIGLVFLESPITEVEPLPVAADHGDVVALVGYHRYVPHMLSGRLDCPVMQRDAHLIRVDCPVVHGNSGGPMLEPDGAGGWQVTGVVSSQERGGDALRAVVVRIPQWVQDVLAER